MSTDHIDLDLALRLHFPIVVIESHDEVRVERLLKKAVAVNLSLGELHVWSASSGLKAVGLFSGKPLTVGGLDAPRKVELADTGDPETLLRHVKEHVKKAVILLPDFHSYLSNPIIVRLIKEIAQQHYINDVVLVFVSHAIDIPDELERLCTHVELSLPDIHFINQKIDDEIELLANKSGKRVSVDNLAKEKLAQNLLGLTHGDITRLIRNAIYDDGAITKSDVKEVMAAKYKLLSDEGALSFYYDTVALDDIGGFDSLKKWLNVRKTFFIDNKGANNLDVPKGMLLVGVQGCGKSLAAKAVAGSWNVPLLKLDVAALYNKYIGETEKNIREALKLSEALAPCVLWVDEIEKAIQGSGDDTGTSNRMLGTLLTWMSENKERVFIVATSNDINKLPPELMRKGRLDEVFFVDLPCKKSRDYIARIHLSKRDLPIKDFDIESIANASDGFSGAEIEQAIISARYQAQSQKQTLSSAHVINALSETKPLSVVRSESVTELRQWAEGRTVAVD